MSYRSYRRRRRAPLFPGGWYLLGLIATCVTFAVVLTLKITGHIH